jgi:dipeptidyl aminopeptidase/acylaminoacyl peptidase
MTARIRVFAAVSALILLAPIASRAQSRVLDDSTFMEIERVTSPAIAPDGKQIVFSRGWIDKVRDQARSNLWIVDSEGARVRELTNGAWRDSDPVWAPDGERIAFLSDRGGNQQLHVLWVSSGEVARRTHARIYVLRAGRGSDLADQAARSAARRGVGARRDGDRPRQLGA